VLSIDSLDYRNEVPGTVAMANRLFP